MFSQQTEAVSFLSEKIQIEVKDWRANIFTYINIIQNQNIQTVSGQDTIIIISISEDFECISEHQNSTPSPASFVLVPTLEILALQIIRGGVNT